MCFIKLFTHNLMTDLRTTTFSMLSLLLYSVVL